MEHSIFAGWDAAALRAAWQAAQSSPEGLAALGITALVMLAAVGLAAWRIAHHVGGFYARMQQEEDEARMEEDLAPEAQAAGQNRDTQGEKGESA